ncbi:unnamed protein product, partial [Amoebophrya sp. A120]
APQAALHKNRHHQPTSSFPLSQDNKRSLEPQWSSQQQTWSAFQFAALPLKNVFRRLSGFVMRWTTMPFNLKRSGSMNDSIPPPAAGRKRRSTARNTPAENKSGVSKHAKKVELHSSINTAPRRASKEQSSSAPRRASKEQCVGGEMMNNDGGQAASPLRKMSGETSRETNRRSSKRKSNFYKQIEHGHNLEHDSTSILVRISSTTTAREVHDEQGRAPPPASGASKIFHKEPGVESNSNIKKPTAGAVSCGPKTGSSLHQDRRKSSLRATTSNIKTSASCQNLAAALQNARTPPTRPKSISKSKSAERQGQQEQEVVKKKKKKITGSTSTSPTRGGGKADTTTARGADSSPCSPAMRFQNETTDHLGNDSFSTRIPAAD